jgi:transcription antitermination factor NusG
MPDRSFQAGDDVRITAGDFAGGYGTVAAAEGPNGIATVAVRIEDREIMIKIPCDQLEQFSR